MTAFIQGNWVESSTNKTFEVRNPFDGSLVTSVADCGAAETRAAIDAAYDARSAWRNTSAKERSAILKKISELIVADADRLAQVLTSENGKPLGEAKGEVGFAASFFDWFSKQRLYGEVIQGVGGNKELFTLVEPLGVAAMICPWNFPIGMPARKMAAALAAGCTCVVKPAEDTPLSTLELFKIIEKAGIPPGVVNMVPCSRENVREVGEEICTNQKVAVVSFTGSCEVGKAITAKCANQVKRMALELGGNAPFIVFSSANIETAVKGLMAAKFRNAGQTCVTANRILIQEDVYDAFMDGFTAAVKALKVGNGAEAGVQIGPLINATQQAKVARIVSDSLEQGATLLLGGEKTATGYLPTILTDVKENMSCWAEEIFGPVASIMKFKTEDEAVKMANDTDRGLAAFFFSNDRKQIRRVYSALEAGMVGCNECAISTAEAPFGGYKTSGIGKEGSKQGLDEYTNTKLVVMGDL